MAEKKNVTKIKSITKDFSFLKKKVLGVLLYGSLQKNEETSRSDIDICIIAPDKDPRDILKEVFRKVDVYKKNYDVHVFEELPLYIKAEIIENNNVIIGDKYDIYEYFYSIRKLWEDQKHRQKITRKQVLEILS